MAINMPKNKIILYYNLKKDRNAYYRFKLNNYRLLAEIFKEGVLFIFYIKVILLQQKTDIVATFYFIIVIYFPKFEGMKLIRII